MPHEKADPALLWDMLDSATAINSLPRSQALLGNVVKCNLGTTYNMLSMVM